MTNGIRYNPTAAHKLLDDQRVTAMRDKVLAARDEALADVELLKSGDAIPNEKQPLDAGFINLPAELLAEQENNGDDSLVGNIAQVATELRERIDRFVVLGIGGSYMGARALFEALCHPFHNELPRDDRDGVPRIYFEGNNLDNDVQRCLLELLESQCTDANDIAQRWGLTVISKSGGTLETAVAFRLFRAALERLYGAASAEARSCVIPVTGEQGKLRDFSTAKEYPHVFPIPDGVGGRFSVFTAVGLLPAAMLGIDIVALLQGAADITEQLRDAPPGENPVIDYVVTAALFEEQGMDIRVLSTWGKRLEALGLWYDQLLSESLGKHERGATPITGVNTRDLHSRGQQHQEGRRDKLITNVIVERPSAALLEVPSVPDAENQDQLNAHAGKTLPQLLSAAIEGTNKAYAGDNRPTADILLPQVDAYCMGQLLQMLMLATAVEGQLIGINPYGQPGVEAYKQNMNEILNS
ncbi:MAG: glucose-6-phosphate isomerase [Planctomycetaceae bacterium]|nr:glucose-6-phosphate isomerase [Planctomycetaceae bacterium]